MKVIFSRRLFGASFFSCLLLFLSPVAAQDDEGAAGAGQASAIEGAAVSPPKNFVVLFDNIEGTGRPLSATFIESSGAEVDERYAAFYHERVAGVDGAFGSLIPNDLPGGVQRIEERSLITGELLSLALFPSGAPGTQSPSTGLVPITIDLRDGGSGANYTAWVASGFPEEDRDRPEISGPDADPDADGIPNLLEYALGGDPLSPDRSLLPRAEINDDRLSLSFSYDPSRPGIAAVVEASTNLSDWSEVLYDSRTDAQPGAERELMVVMDSAPLSDFADTKRFLRLRVILTD